MLCLPVQARADQNQQFKSSMENQPLVLALVPTNHKKSTPIYVISGMRGAGIYSLLPPTGSYASRVLDRRAALAGRLDILRVGVLIPFSGGLAAAHWLCSARRAGHGRSFFGNVSCSRFGYARPVVVTRRRRSSWKESSSGLFYRRSPPLALELPVAKPGPIPLEQLLPP
jgi:hypothetical protein